MMTAKYLLCTCVVLWTLAIRDTVNARRDESPQELVVTTKDDMWADEKEYSDVEDDQENEQAGPLRLYSAADAAVCKLLVTYLQMYGNSCTRKNLVLSIVGEECRDTSVQSILEKLSSVFDLGLNHGLTEKLYMKECCRCVKPGKFHLFRRLCRKQVRPFKAEMRVKDLPSERVFVGRDKGQRTCETTSLIDASLAALPMATERALPTVIMEAEVTSGNPAVGFQPPPLAHTFSYEELLQRMLPRTDRLYWGKDEQGDAEKPGHHGGAHRPSEGQAAGDKDTRLKPDTVYLHTQAQLDLLFPSRTYFPVYVPDPLSKQITVDVRAVHVVPTRASSYVCCSSRVLQLTETSWQTIQNSPCRSPTCARLKGEPVTLAKLLVAREGSVSEQQPLVVLLELCRSAEDGSEFWRETPLAWELSEKTPLTMDDRPAAVPTFGEVLAANSRFASKVVTSISQWGLTRFLVNDMVKRYNINKEEMMSMWDEDPKHSALTLSSVQAAFTRPINTAVLRPIHPFDVLVSPVDSVIQRMYQVAPDDDGIVQDTIVPQLKGINFKLLDLLYGGGVKSPLRLRSKENRLNVLIHYLSPQDYHRVHSPADWIIAQKTYVPGCTPSVARKHLGRNSVLHEIERTSLTGTWDPTGVGEELFFSMTLVAATFVGGISLAWEEKPSSPRTFLKDCSKITEVFRENISVPMCVGQELGSFRLGSTVVLVFESPQGFDLSPVGTCSTVRMGQTEGRLASGLRPQVERCLAYPSAHGTATGYLSWLKENRKAAGDALIKNTHLPVSWRSSPATVVEETVRSIEKGIVNLNAFGQHMFHFLAQTPEKWTRVVVGQPVAVLRNGGVDSASGTQLPLCFPSVDKKQIHLRVQGRFSTLVLFFQTTGEEALLFKQPHFGCDGDTNLGKAIHGMRVTWILQEDEVLFVNINVDCGMGGEDQCVMRDGATVVTGSIHVEARCSADWAAMLQPGSMTLGCEVKKVEAGVVRALSLDLMTRDLICDMSDAPSGEQMRQQH